jgi:hypothetical protein
VTTSRRLTFGLPRELWLIEAALLA